MVATGTMVREGGQLTIPCELDYRNRNCIFINSEVLLIDKF